MSGSGAPGSSAGGPPARPPRPPRSLKRNVAWTILGNVTYAGCQWLMLMMLAKLGTREMVGQFSYALALTAPISVLTSLQLRLVQASDASDHDSFQSYLGLRLLGAALSVAVVGVVAAVAPGEGSGVILVTLGVAKAIEAISDTCYGLFQRHERMDRISRSMVGRGLTSALAFGGAVALTGSVTVGTLALCASWGMALLLHDLPQASALLASLGDVAGARPRFSPEVLWSLARRALPLGAVAFLASLNLNTPRYFLERALGLGDLGLFSAVSYVVVALTMLFAALGHAAIPRLASHHARGERAPFLRLVFILLGVAVALGLGCAATAALAGRQILALVYRPEYAEAQPLFVWISLASMLGLASSALSCGLVAGGNYRAQAPLAVGVTVVAVAACWVLVPRFGLMGAVGAMALSSLAQLAGNARLLRAQLRRGPAP